MVANILVKYIRLFASKKYHFPFLSFTSSGTQSNIYYISSNVEPNAFFFHLIFV